MYFGSFQMNQICVQQIVTELLFCLIEIVDFRQLRKYRQWITCLGGRVG